MAVRNEFLPTAHRAARLVLVVAVASAVIGIGTAVVAIGAPQHLAAAQDGFADWGRSLWSALWHW
jgi:hypothetical protein